MIADITHGNEVSLGAERQLAKKQEPSPYIWTTHQGERVAVTAMTTSHLFYTVRMLYNHSVPEHLRIPFCKRWRIHLPIPERARACKAMLKELETREDIQPRMFGDLHLMCMNLLHLEPSNPESLEIVKRETGNQRTLESKVSGVPGTGGGN